MDSHLLGHIWAVIKNLITLCFILAVFGYLYEPFQIIVFASLLMIYLQVTSFMMTWGKGTMELMFGEAEEFERIRGMLAREKSKHDESTLKELKEQTQWMHIRYWINTAFMGIFWLIAIYHLVFSIW